MIDAHCHLNFHAFEEDVHGVIKEAIDAGVKTIVNVGTKIDSSREAIELAEKYDNLYASVGIHPHHADKFENDWIEELGQLAKHPKVISIGEIGLDYFSYQSNGVVDPALQKKLFREQIELSIRAKKPLQIHNRLAGNDIVEILSEYKNELQTPPGMFHCFSGEIDFLKKVLNLGFYIGFDGNITYEGIARGENTELRELVLFAPEDRIITETDSPYLSPIPFRGLRNTPKNVIIVKEYIGNLKGIDQNVFTQTVIQNFKNVFKVSM